MDALRRAKDDAGATASAHSAAFEEKLDAVKAHEAGVLREKEAHEAAFMKQAKETEAAALHDAAEHEKMALKVAQLREARLLAEAKEHEATALHQAELTRAEALAEAQRQTHTALSEQHEVMAQRHDAELSALAATSVLAAERAAAAEADHVRHVEDAAAATLAREQASAALAQKAAVVKAQQHALMARRRAAKIAARVAEEEEELRITIEAEHAALLAEHARADAAVVAAAAAAQRLDAVEERAAQLLGEVKMGDARFAAEREALVEVCKLALADACGRAFDLIDGEAGSGALAIAALEEKFAGASWMALVARAPRGESGAHASELSRKSWCAFIESTWAGDCAKVDSARSAGGALQAVFEPAWDALQTMLDDVEDERASRAEDARVGSADAQTALAAEKSTLADELAATVARLARIQSAREADADRSAAAEAEAAAAAAALEARLALQSRAVAKLRELLGTTTTSHGMALTKLALEHSTQSERIAAGRTAALHRATAEAKAPSNAIAIPSEAQLRALDDELRAVRASKAAGIAALDAAVKAHRAQEDTMKDAESMHAEELVETLHKLAAALAEASDMKAQAEVTERRHTTEMVDMARKVGAATVNTKELTAARNLLVEKTELLAEAQRREKRVRSFVASHATLKEEVSAVLLCSAPSAPTQLSAAAHALTARSASFLLSSILRVRVRVRTSAPHPQLVSLKRKELETELALVDFAETKERLLLAEAAAARATQRLADGVPSAQLLANAPEAQLKKALKERFDAAELLEELRFAMLHADPAALRPLLQEAGLVPWAEVDALRMEFAELAAVASAFRQSVLSGTYASPQRSGGSGAEAKFSSPLQLSPAAAAFVQSPRTPAQSRGGRPAGAGLRLAAALSAAIDGLDVETIGALLKDVGFVPASNAELLEAENERLKLSVEAAAARVEETKRVLTSRVNALAEENDSLRSENRRSEANASATIRTIVTQVEQTMELEFMDERSKYQAVRAVVGVAARAVLLSAARAPPCSFAHPPSLLLPLPLMQSLKHLKQRNLMLQAAFASGASEEALRLVDISTTVSGVAAGARRQSQAPPLVDLLQLQGVLKLIKRAGQLAESASMQRLLEDADAQLHKTMERVIVAAASASASAAASGGALGAPW